MPPAAGVEAPVGSEGSSTADHGWWPYLLPYVAFLLTIELANRMPESTAGVMLFVKPAVPFVLLLWFFSRGAYPELRRARLDALRTPLDVGLGVLLAVLWMAPYVYIAALRPEVEHPFDPAILGHDRETLVLGVRFFGYALVTPVFEELFIRSFVMRYADVHRVRGDFRLVPLARYSGVSFIATIVVFTIGHVPWEWWVAVPWVAITNLWFYWRRDLLSVIVVHGVTNAAILLIAIHGSGVWTDGSGAPASLWFFV